MVLSNLKLNWNGFSVKMAHDSAEQTLAETQGGSVAANSDLDPGEHF